MHGVATPREDEHHYIGISGGVNLDRWTKREVLESLIWPVMPDDRDEFGNKIDDKSKKKRSNKST